MFPDLNKVDITYDNLDEEYLDNYKKAMKLFDLVKFLEKFLEDAKNGKVDISTPDHPQFKYSNLILTYQIGSNHIRMHVPYNYCAESFPDPLEYAEKHEK